MDRQIKKIKSKAKGAVKELGKLAKMDKNQDAKMASCDKMKKK